ncbi:hypothetical protein Mal15_47230 [Stieleria maiorica]|uniref:Uncharacterized protein n=1 Tax=Stieleria maiorica TaxID=2795974 RepID=A0A5B9MH95_9BACT|nr:hypothetical protein Mal15_47230 [Stieleria maiorica]
MLQDPSRLPQFGFQLGWIVAVLSEVGSGQSSAFSRTPGSENTATL